MQVESIVPDSKTCSKCNALKPLDAFYRTKYGRNGQCKECKKAHAMGQRRKADPTLEQRMADRAAWLNVPSGHKRCRKCGVIKALEAFTRDAHNSDGLRFQCHACDQSYRDANRVEINAKALDKYHGNQEYLNAQRRVSYALAPEKHRARRRAYLKTPAGKESNRRTVHNYRARKLGSVNALTITTGELVERQKGNCFYCGNRFTKRRRPTIDHVIPISKGGPNTNDNVVAACLSCNSSKNDKDPNAYARDIGRLLI